MTAQENELIYVIKDANDFLNVPEDRIDDCLEEFKTYLSMVRTLKKEQEIFFKGLSIPKLLSGFTWVDDGREDITANISIEVEEKPDDER